jgi:hypothetical protein
MPIEFARAPESKRAPPDPGVQGTDQRRRLEPGDEMPTQALADRQTDPVPETETTAQPVVAHQDRRHK